MDFRVISQCNMTSVGYQVSSGKNTFFLVYFPAYLFLKNIRNALSIIAFIKIFLVVWFIWQFCREVWIIFTINSYIIIQ